MRERSLLWDFWMDFSKDLPQNTPKRSIMIAIASVLKWIQWRLFNKLLSSTLGALCKGNLCHFSSSLVKKSSFILLTFSFSFFFFWSWRGNANFTIPKLKCNFFSSLFLLFHLVGDKFLASSHHKSLPCGNLNHLRIFFKV